MLQLSKTLIHSAFQIKLFTQQEKFLFFVFYNITYEKRTLSFYHKLEHLQIVLYQFIFQKFLHSNNLLSLQILKGWTIHLQIWRDTVAVFKTLFTFHFSLAIYVCLMIVYLLFIIWHSIIITILALKYYNCGLIKLFLNNNNILINIIYQYILILIKI